MALNKKIFIFTAIQLALLVSIIPGVSLAKTTHTPLDSIKFNKGDRVQVKSIARALNVRNTPAISGKVLGVQPGSAYGTIIDGPMYDSVDDYWFWKIDYDNSPDGWSAEWWLDKIDLSAPVAVSATNVIPNSSTSQSTSSTSQSFTNFKFNKGDRVQVKSIARALNVRNTPAISGKVLGVQPGSAYGTIIDGPMYDSVDEYWFWKIDYDNSPDGWSAEWWLDKVDAPTPVAVQTPVPAPTPVVTATPNYIPAPMPTPTPVVEPTLTPAPTPTPTPQSTPTTSSSTKLWGVEAGYQASSLADFESRVGKEVDAQALFIHWGNENSFPSSSITNSLKSKNKTLVIFWNPTDYNISSTNQPKFALDNIIRGDFDSYIKSFAASAKAYGGEVILIPFEEANGNWEVWSGSLNGNTPAKVVEAYRHIHDTFGDVSNVKWAMALNGDSVPDTKSNAIELYYPGDAYVDYMGVDGFNFGKPWQSFSEIFDKPLATLKKFNKPIWIFSIASAEGSAKADWIKDALQVQISKHPEVVGWIWFNENKEQNWTVWSSTTALNAFKEAIK